MLRKRLIGANVTDVARLILRESTFLRGNVFGSGSLAYAGLLMAIARLERRQDPV